MNKDENASDSSGIRSRMRIIFLAKLNVIGRKYAHELTPIIGAAPWHFLARLRILRKALRNLRFVWPAQLAKAMVTMPFSLGVKVRMASHELGHGKNAKKKTEKDREVKGKRRKSDT